MLLIIFGIEFSVPKQSNAYVVFIRMLDIEDDHCWRFGSDNRVRFQWFGTYLFSLYIVHHSEDETMQSCIPQENMSTRTKTSAVETPRLADAQNL